MSKISIYSTLIQTKISKSKELLINSLHESDQVAWIETQYKSQTYMKSLNFFLQSNLDHIRIISILYLVHSLIFLVLLIL